VKWAADEGAKEMFSLICLLGKSGNVISQPLPIFLPPGIVALKKRHEELIA
jgi:hypothetical protein